MKLLLSVLLFCCGLPALAAQSDHMIDPALAVVLQECGEVNPAVDHFTCTMDKKYNRPDIEWQIHEAALVKLPTKERRKAWYTYSRLGLHIVQYGYSYILGWPGSQRSQLCRQWTGVSYISIGCIPFKYQ